MNGNLQNIPIIPNKIFFSVLRHSPYSNQKMIYFTVDDVPEFQYHGFFEDFGPPSILQLYQFVKAMYQMMETEKAQLTFYTSVEPTTKANAGLYITFFRMIHLKITPEEAYKPFQRVSAQFKPFRDASTLPSSFNLTILDCLRGIHRAMTHGWFNMDSFDASAWAYHEQILVGDMNWLIPGKLLAFASPYSQNILPGGYEVCTPAEIIPIFKELGISHIVRLNRPFYDAELFKDAGFKHTELYFLDGSVPPQHILKSFLEIIEGDDIIALHCKAGLGRTGTLAGCYMIKNYGFTAHEVIGWLRVCRPGSVIGPQQQFLQSYYNQIHRPMTTKEDRAGVLKIRPPPPKTPRLRGSPTKGFPIQNRENIPGHQLAPREFPLNQKGINYLNQNQIQNQKEQVIRIKKPFDDSFEKVVVRATPVNSFHPQPRKIGQKEVHFH